jgi:hypothetical protein
MSPLHFATILSMAASVGLELIEKPSNFPVGINLTRLIRLLWITGIGDCPNWVHGSGGKSALTLCRYMKFLMMLM